MTFRSPARLALLLSAAVALLALALPACGSPPKACSATTCPNGCCDTQGLCDTGGTALACGSAGRTCTTCSAGQSCVFGLCSTGGTGGGGGAGGGSGGGATGGGTGGGLGGGTGGGAMGGGTGGGGTGGGGTGGGAMGGGTGGGGSALYTIGGTVSGLSGSGLVLANGSDLLPVSANGAFVFPSAVPGGTFYDVTVATQPTSPWQTCSVTSGSGTATGNVGNVSVACGTNSYTVGATVSGLTGSGLVLANGSDTLPVLSNGSFLFSTPVLSGSSYNVVVQTQPSGQTCSVSGGAGTMADAPVVATVTCGGTSSCTWSDDFNRANSTSIGNWVEQVGDWTIESNRLRAQTVATWQYATYTGANQADGEVVARVVYGTGTSLRFAGLTARYSAPSSNIMVKLQDQAQTGSWNALYIEQNESALSTNTSVSLGTDALVSMRYVGSAITVRVDTDRDGTWDQTFTATTTLTGTGGTGVAGYSGGYVDDWQAGSSCYP